jgi:hypothetical protein
MLNETNKIQEEHLRLFKDSRFLTLRSIAGKIYDMSSPIELNKIATDQSQRGFGTQHLENAGLNGNEITVDFVSKYKYEFLSKNINNKKIKPYQLNQLVKESIKIERKLKDFCLNGPVQLSLGSDNLLLVDENQVEAFEVGFGVFTESELPFYAFVVNPEDDSKKVETSVKFFSGRFFSGAKPKTENHFIVSRGLAEKLNVKDDKNITIISVYQKLSDVDLLDR